MMRYVLIALVLVGFAAPSARAEPKTLTIAADEWCPINCSPDDNELGIGIDLAKKIFEPLGYHINYVIMPWARALENVRQGKVDAVVGANTSDDPTLIFPQSAIYPITDDFYVRTKDPFEFKGIESLKGERLGIIKDYGYNEKVQKFIAQQRKIPGMVQEVSGDDGQLQNIQKLLAGRIDVIIESKPVMDYVLAKRGYDDKVRWIGGIPQGNVYVAFSPARAESKELAKQFDKGVARLRKADTLDDLYEAYSLTAP